ncbi:MAG TPA: SMC-Scp complex subunit ScpB [Humisphaera sp.]|nr:SMC-Scp complex subunit ScpB [Humisphaera sp.]
MLRLVRDEDVELDETLDEAYFNGLHDMQEPSPQNEDQEKYEPRPAPNDAIADDEELRDGPVEAADEADSDDDGGVAVNMGALEALLLTTHHPLTASRLAELLDLPSVKPVRGAVKELNSQYESSGRSFRIDQVAGGFQILTLPEFGDHLKKLHQREADAKLTKAALETLAIIAYKQPILRANIEAIRGVACGETIRSLMEKHLVKIAGRAEEPGRPILYGSTKRFLELFGLNSLKDLPQPDALKPVEGKE